MKIGISFNYSPQSQYILARDYEVRERIPAHRWLFTISYPTRAHGIIVKYSTRLRLGEYINNSFHLSRKYARIFVRGHYLFREANCFLRAKLEENCEIRGADNVQGQISEHIFKAKWRLLFLLSFKYFSQQEATSLSI